MVRKKVDSRIRTLIENGVKLRQRTMFVVVGDRARNQVVHLHYMLTKSGVRSRPSVLWCYQKELGFITHRQKRLRKIKREIKRGIRDPDEENPFELFLASTDIRYAYYRDSHKVLGQTFGACVLQDFASMTPNLLARTVETVEGGGLVILLLKSMSSLKQLYTMSMDVHQRYRTESHADVVGRFNERFMLSLASSDRCLVVDDELNILPISSHVRSISKVQLTGPTSADGMRMLSESEAELAELKQTMQDTQPVGSLVGACRTLDQAKAVLTFVEAVAEKTLSSTVVLTAARGRGKSAAMGIAMAGAIAYGYANIFVTAPSPENLKTLFDMVLKGFDALEYKEHVDYEVVQSTNPDFHNAVVRINVFRAHRQTIQFIQPEDYMRLGQAELLVIDEAAAIPLPTVKKLLGKYLVFMSSTVNGYEGTGRSLSLKLVKNLRRQSVKPGAAAKKGAPAGSGRQLREITLDEPIRYAQGDAVETWLNDLLCLDCGSKVPRVVHAVPHPSECEVYHVNRDVLFSYHKGTELFLHHMMALYVSSHYRNTPNDLQLMSDAPAHRLFVLLAPVQPGSTLPTILCVAQVCLEGQISRQSMMQALSRGQRASGDLIPWTMSQQFQDSDFARLSGGRIVRIATHPDFMSMGYASRMLEQLTSYYEGSITSLDEGDDESDGAGSAAAAAAAAASAPAADSGNGESTLLTESIAPRKHTAPLLERLADRKPEKLHYLGVAFGVTDRLYRFWKKAGYRPVYTRQNANSQTGEHTCIMLKPLGGWAARQMVMSNGKPWIDHFNQDFARRFVSLLSVSFRHFPAALALNIVASPEFIGTNANAVEPTPERPLTFEELRMHLTEFDSRRLDAYSRNLVDYHLILDLVPRLAEFFFLCRLPLRLSYTQSAIMLTLGLQRRSVTDIESELNVTSSQILALFNKAVRKLVKHFGQLEEESVKRDVLAEEAARKGAVDDDGDETMATTTAAAAPLSVSLQDELKEAGWKVKQKLREDHKALLEDDEFAVGGTDKDWEAALSGGAPPSSISVLASNKKRKSDSRADPGGKKKAKKQKKHKKRHKKKN